MKIYCLLSNCYNGMLFFGDTIHNMVSISYRRRLSAVSRILILFQINVALESQSIPISELTHRTSSITFLTPATTLHTVPVRINSKRLIPEDIDITKCLVKTNSLLCNEASNYPWREVQKILSSKKLSLEYFGNDSLSSSDPKTIKANDIYEHQFCKSVETIQFPKIAQNKDLDLRYIIQGDTTIFRRGIRTEACLPDTECRFASYLPPGIMVRCVQKYMMKKLVALEPLTGDAYFDEFPVPSCCVCMYQSKDLGDYED